MKSGIIECIEKNKIIVIVRGVEREKLLPLAEAMYRGGIRLIECTYDASGRVSDRETADGIGELVRHFGDDMLVGAGTVLNGRQVELTAEAGGSFIISPDTYPAVIKRTKELGMVSIPGALTPTEAAAAHRAGADLVKLFPIDTYGVGYMKALSAPLSHIKLLAVGGINEDNMSEYLRAGARGVGVATGIVNKKMLAENDFEGITALARKYTSQI